MRSIHLACLAIALHGCGDHDDHDDHDPGADSLTFEALPNPAIIVANGGAGTISVIDPSTLTVASAVTVQHGMHPHHISVSPDGGRVLISATSADLSGGHGGGGHGAHGGEGARTTIYQLEIAERALRAVLTIDATAHNAAFSADGTTVALAMMEHGMIAGYDASTFAERFTATGFVMPLEVTPTRGGGLLVAESNAGRVAHYDIAAGEVTHRFDTGETTVAAWATGEASYYVAAEEGQRLTHLVDSMAGVESDGHAIELGGMPGQAALTPDGRELWVAVEDTGVVAVFDGTTHAPIVEIAAGTKPHGVTFDPSGTRAYVTDETGGRLIAFDVETRTELGRLDLGGKPNGIAWLGR